MYVNHAYCKRNKCFKLKEITIKICDSEVKVGGVVTQFEWSGSIDAFEGFDYSQSA